MRSVKERAVVDARSLVGGARFHAFIDQALLEISKRDASYLSRFPVLLPEARTFSEKAGPNLHRWGLSSNCLEHIVEAGTKYLATKHRTVQSNEGFVAEWIGAALVDSYQAARNAIPLHIIPEPECGVVDVLSADYYFRSTTEGDYYVRRAGALPLVVINATGLPIETWRRFLSDPTHDYKVIVPCRPHGDLFAGGIRDHVSVEEEAAQIIAIVRTEGMAHIHLLSWCNGARLAIEVTSRLADRAASLTLLAPMFKGIPGISPMLTPYLRDLQLILQLVARDPASAWRLAGKLSDMANPVDWSKVAEGDTKHLEEIFRLPNRERVRLLLEPMLSANSLLNVARRVASDESHPTLARLSAVRAPIVMILGSHDAVVSNQAALETLRRTECKYAALLLLGAGHDLHDLQYPYLRYLLDYLLNRGALPVASARVRRLA